MSVIRIYDLETNNNPYYGAVASPRHPDNYVVMAGWADGDGPVQGVRYESKEEAANWLDIPDNVSMIVAHNASYELDWMLHQQRATILKFLKRGGRIFCTALAHYLLSNQQDTYPSLDQIAPQYGGSHKVDGIKILWEQGVLTKDIDPALLSEYLLGPEGDIENTRKVFHKQYTKLMERGMWDMCLARCEALMANAIMMDTGLYVNPEIAQAQLATQQARYNELTAKFQLMRTGLPDGAEFKESSGYHMSAWLYGGPLKYRAKVPWTNADGTPAYEKVDAFEVKGKFIPVVDGGDVPEAATVFKSGKNKGQPKVFKVDTDVERTKWGELSVQLPGIAPLTLVPRDVSKAFLDEFAGKQKLADGSPVISTSKDALDVLAARKEFPEEVHQVLLDIQEFAKVDKDIGTYYLREVRNDDGVVVKTSGMLQYVQPNGIINHNLNQTSTATTRLSANKPNMQNTSRGDTSDVKKIFTSRFGPTGLIIEADYSALEVVTLAAFSKDTNLSKALLDGIDMHCMRLAGVLKEPYEDVYEKCHNQEHPEHKKYKSLRTDIKPRAFALTIAQVKQCEFGESLEQVIPSQA